MQIAAAAKTAEERGQWLRQLADMISAAVQSGTCPDGAERLQRAVREAAEERRRQEPGRLRQVPPADGRVRPEHAGAEGRLRQDSGRVAEDAGAVRRRLPHRARRRRGHAPIGDQPGVRRPGRRGEEVVRADCGRVPRFAGGQEGGRGPDPARFGRQVDLAFSGQSPLGSPVDLARYRGKVVLVQYWATWSGPAKADMATLKELWNKYGRSFTIIGVSLDNNVKDLNAYLAENPLPWPQIFEEGGLDSRPANVLGILTVPTMILVDQQGKVVSRNVSAADLGTELKKLIR